MDWHARRRIRLHDIGAGTSRITTPFRTLVADRVGVLGSWDHRVMQGDVAFSQCARAATSNVARRSSGPALDRSLRVTLNFHPDRQVGGISVVERLGIDRVYRSQFQTATSNGGSDRAPRW